MCITSYAYVVRTADFLRHSASLAAELGVTGTLPVGGVVLLLFSEISIVAVTQHKVALRGFPKISVGVGSCRKKKEKVGFNCFKLLKYGTLNIDIHLCKLSYEEKTEANIDSLFVGIYYIEATKIKKII